MYYIKQNKYPDEIDTISSSLHHYSNTHVLESRNGYLVDDNQLFQLIKFGFSMGVALYGFHSINTI